MILFIDTETTGLPKNWKAPVTDLENWPRLVQLAYLVYDLDGNLINSCNEIVKPYGFTIPQESSKVHGITTDIANKRGRQIEDIFELFYIHLKRAKVIVAHNMAYDEKIIGSELIRMGLDNIVDSKEKICTMISTMDFCKINSSKGYKWPKLEELHQSLFGHNFEGAHNALADIQATAKCYWELIRLGVLDKFEDKNVKYIDIPKSLSDKFRELEMLNQNKSFDVPFIIIDKDGNESWTLFNTKLNIKHVPFEYHEIPEVMVSRILDDKNLWCNVFYVVNPFKDSFNNPLYSKEDMWANHWHDWEVKNNGHLYFGEKFLLDMPKIFSTSWIEMKSNIKGFHFLNTNYEISKVVAHYKKLINYNNDIFFDDAKGEETVFEEYYFTLFYIDQNGSVFLENNQLEFDTDSCVPFLNIDQEGNSSWQFYNYQKDLFFGRIYKDHSEIEDELNSKMLNKSTSLWQTDYPLKITGLNEWKGWNIDNDGLISFQHKLLIDSFKLKINIPHSDAFEPLILDSESCISKIIICCYDADHLGLNFEGYFTLFYIDEKGRIYLENNYPPEKEVESIDPLGLISEFEAEKDFRDGLFDMI